MKNELQNEIVIFRTDDEAINVEVRFEDETAWLTQDQMSTLFGKSKSTINEHIKNIFEEGELIESQVMRKFGNSEFTGNLTKLTNFYNLDVIISVGYRVKSLRGTQFRQWATSGSRHLRNKHRLRSARRHFHHVFQEGAEQDALRCTRTDCGRSHLQPS